MLEFTIPILKISAPGGSYSWRALLKPPQNLPLICLEYLNPSYGEATGNKASRGREMQKSKGKNHIIKGNALLIKMPPRRAFQYCAHVALIKLLIQNTLLVQFGSSSCCFLRRSQRQKFLFPSLLNRKEKPGNKQFNSHRLLNASQCAPLTPFLRKTAFQAPKRGEGSGGQGLRLPLRSPRSSHCLSRALMDIKNRTKQARRWEQTPGLARCSHSAVKCKNKKGQTSCIPQDASRFFNIVVPPHISLRMLHYIYMSLKYLPFFFFVLNSAGCCESLLRAKCPWFYALAGSLSCITVPASLSGASRATRATL